MKFTEHLGAHITPEWRKQYISYEEMKAMLYAAVEQAPESEAVEPEVLRRYFAKFDEEFFHYCDKELAKINTFYSEKLAEATRKFSALKSELYTSLENQQLGKQANKMRGGPLLKKPEPVRKRQELKLAFSEFYLSLILLQNYQNLNFTGFRKILKKHDKLLSVDDGAKWRSEHVETAHFYINKDIDRLIRETEVLVTQDLECGDRQKAMKRLRVPPLGEQQSPWITFKVGLFSGSFMVLLVTAVLSIIARGEFDDWRVAVRLYRGPFLVIEFLFLISFNVYGWRSSGVNHVLIFELDPRNHLSEQHIMEFAAIFGVIWTLSLLSFIYSSSLGIHPYINPLILFLLMVVFLCNPTRTFRHEARFWAVRVLGRVLLAPFFYVGFADFWVADQLNSMVPAIQDFHFLICFYIVNAGNLDTAGDASQCVEKNKTLRSIVGSLPAWFRFAQCLRRYRDTKEAFPHLVNAGKYSTTFWVMLFSILTSTYKDDYEDSTQNPFFYLWILASVVSTIYAYTWDIKMDWGLFDKKAGDNKFLREEIVYSSVWYYYFAIAEDFLLRFGWAVSLSLTEMGYIHAELMVTILSVLEVTRRFVWNYFRLENEHLNNCGKFRAVRDISVAPMDTSDQVQIVRMMDDEDGVVNRKRRNRHKAKEHTRLLLEMDSADSPNK